MKDKIAAYKDLLKVSKKYSDIFDDDSIVPRTSSIEGIIRALEVSDRFGIPLQNIAYGGSSYVPKKAYDEWTRIALHSKGSISYSDDGRQPDDEWLFRIQFTTGAYIFGQSYPTETFNAFWEELKSYNPAYCDTANHSIYFRDDVAKVVYDNFWDIFSKYKSIVGEELKAKRKKELEDELAKLG